MQLNLALISQRKKDSSLKFSSLKPRVKLGCKEETKSGQSKTHLRIVKNYDSSEQ